MLVALYREQFSLPEQFTRQELKASYRSLVKQHHPDLFPEEQKQQQKLRLIQISAAYERLLHTLTATNTEPKQQSQPAQGINSSSAIIPQKDTDYHWYKQGVSALQRAINRQFKSHSFQLGDGRTRWDAPFLHDENALTIFKKAFSALGEADEYFSRLLQEYPQSIWAADAKERIKEVNRFYLLYKKIVENLHHNL